MPPDGSSCRSRCARHSVCNLASCSRFAPATAASKSRSPQLEIRAGDGRLEIEIAATPVTLQRRGKGVVAVPGTELPALTAEQVRETLERVRR